MLVRVNSALFEAPPGVPIQIVAESQGNNGVNEARFEYAFSLLTPETILGLPGCSFTVEGTPQILETEVVFDSGAPGSARYDLFEVENGVKNDLLTPVKHSDSSHKVAFTIDPVLVAVAARAAGKKAAKKKAPAKKVTKKTGTKKVAKKATGKKTTKKAAAKKKKTKTKTKKRPR